MFYFCSVYDVIYKDDKLKETGVQVRLPENSPDNVFSSQLILYSNGLSMVLFQSKLYFSKISGGPTFSVGGGGGVGGVELFPGGGSKC